MIPIYQPHQFTESIEYAKKAIDSNWISSQGEYLDSCKEIFKNKFGYKYVIFTSNGTTACHLMAEALKFKYPNIKNIVVPNNVYVAAWNTFKMSTDYNLIFVDADLETWNANYHELENLSPEDTAFLIVHNVGNIINVPKLKKRFPGFVFLEDACEGLMGKYENQYAGSASWVSAFSFFANKNLTSGEGGALVTQDKDIFEYLNSIKNQGAGGKTRYVFERLGYNYRMTNIQAAILQGQLENLDYIKKQKKRVFDKYTQELGMLINWGRIDVQKREEDTQHANWIFAFECISFPKSELEMTLFNNEIQTRPMFPPVNYHGHYSHIKTDTKNAKHLYESCLMLPSYPDLTDNQISFISDKIKNICT